MKEDIISNTLKSMVERIGDAENQLILLQKSLRNWQKQKRRLRRSLCKIWEEKERIMKDLGNGSKSVTESNMKTGSSIGNRECTSKKECLTEKGGNEGVEHGKRFAQNTENESTLLRKHVHHDAQKKKWKTTNTKNRTVMNSESGNIRDDNMNFVNNCSSTVANVNMGVLQSVQSSSNSLVNNTSLQSSTLSDFSKGTQSDGSVDSRLSALDMRSSKNLLCVSDVGEINSDSMTGSTDLFEFQSDDEKCASSMKAKHRTKLTKLKLPSAQGRGTYSKQGNIILASDCRRSPRVQLTDIASIMLGKGINVYTPYESPIVLLKKQMGETEAESAGKSRRASTFMGQEGFTAHGDVSSNMGASTTMAQEKVIADGEVSSNMGASTTLHQEKVIADGDASSNMGASTTMGQEKVIADENVSSNMEVSKTMNQDKVIADRTVSSNMGASTTLHQEKVIADGDASSNMGASTTMGQEKVIADENVSSNMEVSKTMNQDKVIADRTVSSNMGASTTLHQEKVIADGEVSSNMGANTTMGQEKVIANGDMSSNMGASTTLRQEKVVAYGDMSSNMGASTTLHQEKVIAYGDMSSNMGASTALRQEKVIADGDMSSNMGTSTTLHQKKVIAGENVSSNMGASTTLRQEKVIADGEVSSNMGASTTLRQEKVIADGEVSSNMGASTTLRQEKVIADGEVSSNMGASTTLRQEKVIAGENVSSNMGASTTLRQEKVIADGEVSSNMGASTTLRQEKVIADGEVSSNKGASTTLRQEKVIADGEVSSNMGASTTLRQEKVIADGEVSSNKGASTTLRQEKVIADGEVSSNMGASTTMGQEKVIADGDVSSNVVRVSVKTSVEQPSRFGVNAKADTNKVAGKSIMVKDKASSANGQRRGILNDTTCRESSARKTTEGGLEISPDLLLFKIISTMTPNGNTCNDVAVNKFVSSNSSMVTERGLIRKEMVGERGQQKCLEGPETSNRLASDPLKAKYVDKVGMTERRGHQKCLEGQEKSINLAREPLKARLVAKRRQFERGIDSHCSAEEPICNEVENEIQGVNSPKKPVITEQASCVKEVSARNEAKLNKEMLSRKQTASLTETTSIGTDRLGGPEVRRKDTAPNNKRKCNEGVDSSTSNIAPSNEKRPHVASKDDVIVRTESSSSTENPFWKEASSRLKAFINESLKKKAVKSESNQNIGGNNHPVTTQSLSRQQTSWISGLQESLELFSRATKKTDVELKPILPHSYHRKFF